MTSKLLGTLLVGAGCIGAGVGAYVAVRHNASPATEVAASQPSNVVTETEQEIPTPAETFTPERSAPAPNPVTTPAPVAAPVAPVVTPKRTGANDRDRQAPQTGKSPSGQVPAVAAEASRPAPTQDAPVAAQSPVGPAAPLPMPNQSDPGQPGASRPVDPPQVPMNAPVNSMPDVPPMPLRQFDELVVPADAVIGLQIDRSLNSDTARVEDRLEARVTRDVRVGGKVAIPAGSRARGTVVMVERGGKFRDRARLGVRFHTLVLADGTSLSIHTETVYREGDAPGAESSAKIGGGAIAGAIIGAIAGGGKGAMIGGATGAGAGTAAVMAGGRNAAVLQAGANVTVRLASPLTVTVEQH